ncbi:MAG: hypothetical protein IT375_03480 [Polyangiaceae bacterium]|nr:hypothetical protein [Polyangiaceae bacterium]
MARGASFGLALSCALLVSSCLFPEASVEAGPKRDPAAGQCDIAVEKLCRKSSGGCIDLAACVTATNQSFRQQWGTGCDGADSVGDTYYQCMNVLDTMADCSMSDSPDVCKGIILFNTGSAGSALRTRHQP